MSTPKAETSEKSPLTAERAVLLGHLIVILPVLSIIALGYVLGYFLSGPVWAMIGLVLGVTLAWLWWAVSVPRWREWAKRRGADEERTQFLGQRSGLVWPRGWIFEKTELRPRKKQ